MRLGLPFYYTDGMTGQGQDYELVLDDSGTWSRLSLYLSSLSIPTILQAYNMRAWESCQVVCWALNLFFHHSGPKYLFWTL